VWIPPKNDIDVARNLRLDFEDVWSLNAHFPGSGEKLFKPVCFADRKFPRISSGA
jgi:hypothetical protein